MVTVEGRLPEINMLFFIVF